MMMRLAILGIITGVMIFCVVGLATVLTLAAVVSGMGDVTAGIVLRYVALGIGVFLAVDTVVLLLWLVFLTVTAELALNQVIAAKKDQDKQMDSTTVAMENLADSEWEETSSG